MEKFIIDPFNGVFFAMFGIFFAVLIASSILLRKASRKTKRTVLLAAFLITFVFYWVYKIFLSLDAEYDVILQENQGRAFSWWAELPLQLCNINLMLIPLACILDNKRLYAFCFVVAPLAALMAVLFPSLGFSGNSIFLMRNLGFYGTHMMIIVGGIAIASFGLYRPSFRDIPLTFLTLVGISAVIIVFDFIVNKGCGISFVNYFYAMNPEGISILEVFYKLIPVPGLYIVVTGLVILIPYVVVVTGAFELVAKIKNKKQLTAEKTAEASVCRK